MPRSKKTDASTTPARKGSPGSKSTWKVMDRAATIGGALLARQISTGAWRAVVGRKPPTTGRHPEVETREAIAWAVVGGALIELTRLLTRRWAATYYVKSTGHLPPGMKPIRSDGKLSEPAKAAATPQAARVRRRG